MNNLQHDSKAGSALIMAMFFMVMTTSIAGVYLSYAAFDAQLARRSIDQEKLRIAAEGALDYGIVKLRDMTIYHQFSLPRDGLQMLLDDVEEPDEVGDFVYVGPEGQDGFKISVDSEPISGVITQGFAVSDDGTLGNYQVFTITAGAKNPASGNSAVLKQTVQTIGLPLIRYGVFYEDDLEINPGPNMSFAGPVHCNADMYLKPGANLFFYDRVTAHGNMYRHRKDTTESGGYVGINNANDAEVAMTIDSHSSSWMAQALNLWQGRVLSGAHGVERLSPPISDLDTPHDLIERMLATNDPSYHIETEAEKYMNKASLIIRVATNGVLTAFDSHGSNLTYRFTNAVLVSNGSYSGMALWAKTNNMYRFVSNGAYSTTTTNFFDARENVYLRPIDIYLNELLKAVPELTNATYSIADGRGVVYVTRDDPDGTNGVRPVLRLRNMATIPLSGFSIASDLPIYLEGNYNIASNRGPSFVAGDAVTMLSVNWQDARCRAAMSARVASNTTYNVIIITGNTETTPGHYNGGLENVMRFLEDWSGRTVTFRGSVIDLWYSEIANAPWIDPGGSGYYNAPTRNYGYDTIYRTVVPPGMTHVFGLEEVQWSEGVWD